MHITIYMHVCVCVWGCLGMCIYRYVKNATQSRPQVDLIQGFPSPKVVGLPRLKKSIYTTI